MIKTCELCGKQFIPTTKNARYCGEECRIKVKRQRTKEWQAKRKQEKKEQRKQEFKRLVAKNELKELTIEARKHGMSYGKYVALLEMGARV